MAATIFLYAKGDSTKRELVITTLQDEGTLVYSETITNTNKYDGSEDGFYYVDIETYNIEFCTAKSEMGQLLLDTGDLVDVSPLNLPTTWEEYLTIVGDAGTNMTKLFTQMGTTMSSFPAADYSDAYIAFIKLIYLRDCYRNGWTPNIESDSPMYVVLYNKNELCSATTKQNFNNVFSFQNQTLRDLFVTSFKMLLTTSKNCLGWNETT